MLKVSLGADLDRFADKGYIMASGTDLSAFVEGCCPVVLKDRLGGTYFFESGEERFELSTVQFTSLFLVVSDAHDLIGRSSL